MIFYYEATINKKNQISTVTNAGIPRYIDKNSNNKITAEANCTIVWSF